MDKSCQLRHKKPFEYTGMLHFLQLTLFGDFTGHAVPNGFIETCCSHGMHRLLRFVISLQRTIKIEKLRNF